ncbi:MAG: hypothetical protein C0594_08330 [Marinilabiliales bacterium]|nr:MAG: hypothetical protein C0594_08330 [Marinilabiliales bacterium]
MSNPVFKSIYIYYFSGTGNAKAVAHWIADEIRDDIPNIYIYNIDKDRDIHLPHPGKKSMIGICYPTHGFNAPPIVLKFISALQKGHNQQAFLVNTRAGMKMWKFFTYGLSGIALWLPSFILLLKNYKRIRIRSIDLPSNWIAFHPGIKKSVVKSIVNNWEKVSRKFAKKLLSGEKSYRSLLDLPFDILISPIAVVYYLIGRFFLAKTYIAGNKCTQCDLCIKNCPVGAIRKINDRPFWTYKCESCMRCLNLCPQKAIEVPHLYIGLILLGTSLLSNYAFSEIILPNLDNIELLWQKIVSFLVWNMISLPIYFLVYKITHHLMAIKIISNIITWLSLTHLKFWRRYKFPIKNKD